MYYLSFLVTVISFIQLKKAAYLPSIIWDKRNPILQKRYWNQVVNLQIFDELTFICPHRAINFQRREALTSLNELYYRIYVKQVQADIRDYSEACDSGENSTAKMILDCQDPAKLTYESIQMNIRQSHPDLPVFEYKKHYMFYATSNGTQQSLGNESRNCTIVFRIYFDDKNKQSTVQSCPLYERQNVCNYAVKTTECKVLPPPVDIKVHSTSEKTIQLSWTKPRGQLCDIAFYTVCYRSNESLPCNEVSVSGDQNSVILNGLKTGKTYFVKMRAHSTNGRGNYSNETEFVTGRAFAAHQKRESTKIDSKSMAIGFAAGFALSIILVFIVWIMARIRERRKQSEDLNDNANCNNVRCKKGDVTSTNNDVDTGSCERWKLPSLRGEENLHLSVSEA
ncbi:uncharacterized protein LOC124452553 [Xenia sp. Carnegie-2017]|uniref:uncharacterized protein LOC124452553 n=1 Tax=Xenia sp. Carnegie-2017 TaxID=2897299 RepID=UPI001F03F140|nr:uncharacterized protein LOC124452553 [Xenia sp. Carnegie-2017]